MAKIIGTRDFVNDNIEMHLDKLNSRYTSFLETQPTETTYYNVSVEESDITEGFGSLDDIRGNSTPLKFKRISDFLLYGIEKTDFATQIEEYGMEHEIRGEAVILPNTIIPNVDDFFTINYVGKQFVFKIRAYYKDHIKSSNYYRIEYELYKYLELDEEIVPSNKIIEDHIMLYEDSKVNSYHIINKFDYNQRNILKDIFNNMMEKYKIKYYKSKLNSFVLEDETGNLIYDIFSTEFIQRHNIFAERHRYDNIHVRREISIYSEYDFMRRYTKTIYGKISDTKFNDVGINSYILKSANTRNSIFDISSKTVRILDYETNDELYQLDHLLAVNFIENAKNNSNNLIDALDNIIYKGIKGDSLIEEDLELLSSYQVEERNLRDYTLTPIILYILNKYIEL